jgi:hypothetical protein
MFCVRRKKKRCGKLEFSSNKFANGVELDDNLQYFGIYCGFTGPYMVRELSLKVQSSSGRPIKTLL